MSEIKTLQFTSDELRLLNSCLNDLKIIMFTGSSEIEGAEEQARINGIKLEGIQSKIAFHI